MNKLTFTVDPTTGDIAKQEPKIEIETKEVYENALKQLIQTVVEEVSDRSRQFKELANYPPVLQAHHIQELTGFSAPTVYEILRSEDCPTFMWGTRMVIARDEFWKFFTSRSIHKGIRNRGAAHE